MNSDDVSPGVYQNESFGYIKPKINSLNNCSTNRLSEHKEVSIFLEKQTDGRF